MKPSVLMCAASLALVVARADTTVTAPTPGGPGTDSDSVGPFLIQQLGDSSMRYQQVYGATEFAGLDPGGELITSLTFFIDDKLQSRIYSWTLQSFQINLSTTSKAVDSLSPVFSLNTEPDDKVVFGPGQHTFIGAGAGDPVTLTLPQPFLYNPALGNLLMDVRVFVAGGMFDINNPALDAQLTPLDSVSIVFARNVSSLSGTTDTLGLRTRFTTKSVPEPSAGSMLFFAGGMFATIVLGRGKRF